MPILVHYATNRPWTADGYGTAASPGADDAAFATLRFGTIKIDGSADPAFAGTLAAPRQEAGTCGTTAASSANLVAFLRDYLTQAQHDGATPLLYVHGFNYTFTDAVVRTADVVAFYAAAIVAPKIAALLFSWPSLGSLSSADYLTDRSSAQRSGEAFGALLAAFADAWQQAGRPVAMLLAHSMGAWALDNGLQAFMRMQPVPPPLFAQAFVLAGDDDDTVFNEGGGLRPLQDLATWVTVGINNGDEITRIDQALVLRRPRLANFGPVDLGALQPNVYIVDYTTAATIHDEQLPGGTDWNDWTHNYYHTVPRVRDDLAQAFAGTIPEAVAGRIVPQNHPQQPSGKGAGWRYVVPYPETFEAWANIARAHPTA